jgi:methenyltetrahydromethanopterin cyclohydrolase
VFTRQGSDAPGYLVIAANSGRMLAEAARRAGFRPLVIDLFADLDTQRHAEAFRKIPSLDKHNLAPAVDYFVRRYAVAHAVYGSGLEGYPESLRYLDSRLRVLGNRLETFIRLHDKPAFFAVLDTLSIPHPEVCFTAPTDAGQWLVKPMQGQGGAGIKRYRPDDNVESGVYWQKYQPGTQHSVLFLADGRQAQVIGFNTQWTIFLGESREFIFSGIINNCELSGEQKQRVTDWLGKLVPEFALKGLNSLDFIQDGDSSVALEINPRPPAGMQLYDADLLTRHIGASRGELPADVPLQTGCTGYQIVYAERDVIIPNGFEWPEGCVDLPGFGVMCRAGQPICSIIARQNDAQAVMNALLTKQLNLTKRFTLHGI